VVTLFLPNRLRLASVALFSLALGACGLEGELVGPLTDRGHVLLPQAADTIVTGRVAPELAGGALAFQGSGGISLGGITNGADDDGAFVVRFSGALAARGVLILAELGAQSALGLLPELPAQPTVFHEERWVALGDAHPVLGELGLASTAASLLVLRAAHLHGVTAGALTPEAIVDALDQALALMAAPSAAASAFASSLATLDAAASASAQTTAPWALETLAGGPALQAAWLAAELVDLDGDGWQDVTSATFDAALSEAAGEITLSACYVPGLIPVVFQVALGVGNRDGNCAEVNPYKWAAQDPASLVSLTGGVHPDTPICDDLRLEACLPPAAIDGVHQSLGAWEPNGVPMFDDGTHGDAQAGDGIWTITVQLPFWAPGTAPDGAGLRIGYKYTYGLPGQGWTSSEEWPGNQRILEIADVNGDHLVVRRDVFADEASNKDKVNGLAPSQGGCGTNVWEADANQGCASDTRERMIDTDGDCVADTWPHPGPVVPILEACDGAP
jgi:hypothetical protein